MKRVVLGFVVGVLVSISIQSSAQSSKWYYRPTELQAINQLGEVLVRLEDTQNKIYSKLKSIDERLLIENSKGY